MGALLPAFFILAAVLDGASCLNSDHIWTWINDTFCTTSSCTYRKEIFPRDTLSDTIYVDMELSLISLSDFDEVAGHLELVGTLRIKWIDDIVLDPYKVAAALTPPTYSFTDVLIPQDDVWKPPITVFNSVNALNAIGDSNYYVRIKVLSSGAQADMEWFPGIVTRTACNVDVSNYPWDIQTCDILFTPWGYRPSEIDFNLTSTAVDVSKFQGSDIWEIKSTTISHETKGNSSFAKYTLQLARKSSFFLMYIVLPIELLCFLNLMVFILPADSGERVGYSVTVFLTLAVYVTIISDNLPKTSNPMSIFAYFMITMLMISAFICFVTIISLRAYIRNDEDPVPKWVKRCVAVAYCRCCVRKKGEEEEETASKKPPTPKPKIIKVDSENAAGKWAKVRERVTQKNGVFPMKMAVLQDYSDSEESTSSDAESEEDEEMEWSDVGTAIDIACLYLFFALISLVSIAFLIPLASTRM
ncbi:neuronal acetylcholine receptor subunit alpha-6-like [Saccostrea echinata]|uniref:neuronal acetylcholine receptor subunit alpha-6-like n=1 Tax=Saccostrea echinata TaxID=191078 RepID=UPI002A7EA64E|nr:neuronal acetylcholine receptor subunit alpha-6-like [Saccostrea echinata]